MSREIYYSFFKKERCFALLVIPVALFLLWFATQNSSNEVNDLPEDQQATWTVIFHNEAERNLDFPISDIQQAMLDIMSLTNGEVLSWQDCPGVRVSLVINPVLMSSNSLMAITEETDIRTFDLDQEEVSLEVSLQVSTLFWELFQPEIAQVMWHEYYHIRQLCRLVSDNQLYAASSLETANTILNSLMIENAPQFEAEVIAVSAYWFQQNLTGDLNSLLDSLVLFEPDVTLFEVWEYIFSSEEELSWDDLLDNVTQSRSVTQLISTEEEYPIFSQHPNWDLWIHAIEVFYIEGRLRIPKN